MASRLLSNRIYSAEKDRKILNAHVTIGATGAPTLVAADSIGVISITRNSAGDYTVVFGTPANGVNVLDTYYQFLFLGAAFKASGAPAAPDVGIKSIDVKDPAKCSLEFVCFNNSGTATDPGNGEEMFLHFEFGDSSAP